MTTRSRATPFLGAITAAMLLADAPASAQTITNPGTKPDQRAATAAAAKPAHPAKTAQPAKPAKPAVTANAPAAQGTDYWAINTDLGRYRDTKSIAEPNATNRVPLQGAPGSVGLGQGTSSTGQFVDGRATPGLERYNQDSSSYAGVSMSLSNSNKSFPLPTQLLPHNSW